jgi:hypothetical protein
MFNKVFGLLLVSCTTLLALGQQTYRTEDLFVPDQCESVVGPGDHLLLEYEVNFKNGTKGSYLKKPFQLFHIIVNMADESPVLASVKGMCKNATRRLIWDEPSKIDLYPLFVKGGKFESSLDGLYLDITTAYVTTSEEYQIFSSLRQSNFTNVVEMIDNHIGVNAVDEWGQTPLMIAVQMKHLPVIAALLNTRLPKVDVNAVKPVSRSFHILVWVPSVLKKYGFAIKSVWLHCFILCRGAQFSEHFDCFTAQRCQSKR